MARSTQQFVSVRSVGGLLSSDILARVSDADADLPGMAPTDYGLGASERLRDVIQRSWTRLVGVWHGFQAELDKLPEGDRATTPTRERWLLVVLQELGFGRVAGSKAVTIDGMDYPISHRWGTSPLHLLGWGVELDRRSEGVAGAARMSPHGLVQEFLNRSDDNLWGVVSNGRQLRLLRDNVSMSRQAYVEFDLEAMFEGDLYPDFVLLWLACHATRFEGERPELCWLEQWVTTAEREGTRARERLRDGVEDALVQLGTGLVEHPANSELRERLRSGELSAQDFYRQLLRVVYRLLFLIVSEDRDLLLLPGDEHADGRARYRDFYSTARLREIAGVQGGTRHEDRWRLLTFVFALLGTDEGAPALALPPLGSGLWDPAETADLTTARLHNSRLLEAVRKLTITVDEGIRRPVDYRNLGADELGSVYEALLELHPEVSLEAGTFALTAGAGNERKTTGSYYTPTSLINQLLDTALDPILDREVKADDPEAALLDITVCDPACGSGHFLVAAAKRIANRLAVVRTGEASLEAVQEAMREVVSRCIYGVDINAMAIELAKVNLWMECHVPGRPLTFLNHHLKVGNALLGTTPALIARGIPDDAFKAITGDDKKTAASYKKRNRQARGGETSLFASDQPGFYDVLSAQAQALTDATDDTIASLHDKEKEHAAFESSQPLQEAQLIANAWCAAFTALKVPGGGVDVQPFDTFYRLRDHGVDPSADEAQAINAESRTYQYFHWHLEFPHLFTPVESPAEGDPTGWTGGFTVMVGNPPWEHTELKEQEFFATRDSDIASASGVQRKRMIKQLGEEGNSLFDEFQEHKRRADAWSHFARGSGRYPLTGMGRINTYALFAELFRNNASETGRSGFIVPTGIATDFTTRHFFADLVDSHTLASLFDFENAAPIFPGVHRSYKFALVTLTGEDVAVEAAEFAFFAHDVTDLSDPERRFELTAEDIALINPNTRTAPVFRTRRDAEITARIYRNVPVLLREDDPAGNPWHVEFKAGLFHMTSASHLFRTRDQLEKDGWTLVGNAFERAGDRYVPLYEAKMFHQFDDRWSTYEPDGSTRRVSPSEKVDAAFSPMPRYWVPQVHVVSIMTDIDWAWDEVLAFRRVSRSTDVRSGIFAVLPAVGTGDSVFLMRVGLGSAAARDALVGVLNSFASDYVIRVKAGGLNLNFFIVEQLAVPDPEQIAATGLFRLESLAALAREISVTPTDSERGELLRLELDAAMFHVYGLDADEVADAMDTFPIVRRQDERDHGEYRTKRLILEIYDEMAEAIETGEPYQTRLDPPPADPSLQVSAGSR